MNSFTKFSKTIQFHSNSIEYMSSQEKLECNGCGQNQNTNFSEFWENTNLIKTDKWLPQAKQKIMYVIYFIMASLFFDKSMIQNIHLKILLITIFHLTIEDVFLLHLFSEQLLFFIHVIYPIHMFR
jgi:hypothetical protein